MAAMFFHVKILYSKSISLKCFIFPEFWNSCFFCLLVLEKKQWKFLNQTFGPETCSLFNENFFELFKRIQCQRLRKWGGKGGICPPWKFQDQVTLPNFAPWKAKIWKFSWFYSTLPPPLGSTPCAIAVLILQKLITDCTLFLSFTYFICQNLYLH